MESIELILDNLESIVVKPTDIGYLHITNIKKSINKYIDTIVEEKKCSSFSIGINRDFFKDNTFLERLINWNDISYIVVHYNNEVDEMISIDWKNNKPNGTENQYQKSYVNQFGDLFIVIDKEKNIKDIFDIEEIENKECMEDIWEMTSSK